MRTELSTSRLELLVGVSSSFIESQVNMKSRVSWVSVWENTYPEENYTGRWAVHHWLGVKNDGCMPFLAQTEKCQSGAG